MRASRFLLAMSELAGLVGFPAVSWSKPIPVEDLFGESAAISFSLSPDGAHIALIGRNAKGKRSLYARSLETGVTQAWTIDGGDNEVANHNPETINKTVSANLSAGRFLVRCYSDRQPSVYRLLDYRQRRILDLWPTRPQVDPGTMAPVESFAFVSRDALPVKPAPSKRMIAALKKHGVDCEVFSKFWEGHGVFDDKVQFKYYRKIEAFPKKNL